MKKSQVKNIVTCAFYISAFLVNGWLWAITLSNGQSSFEKSAAKRGADFVKSHPDAEEHDIKEFCSNAYPITMSQGKLCEIELRQQTACITGAKEALTAQNNYE